MTALPRVSIVIPVYNSRKTIEKCIESLLLLDHESFEIIIVDDGSTDGTPELCDQHAEIHLIRLSRGGPSRARNVGIAAARGEFVAFTDGDCLVDAQWLKELEVPFADPRIAGTGGDQKSPDDETQAGRIVQEFLKTIGFITGYIKTDAKLRETEHNPSCNSMYRKQVLLDVGGFDESLWPGEDVELDLKIVRKGHKLVYNPSAVVFHYRPSTYRGFYRMMLRYGASQWPLVMKYGLFRKLHYIPLILIVCLAGFLATLYREPMAAFLVVILPALFFLWFLRKTESVSKSLTFTGLILGTIICWNWGFFSGCAHKNAVQTEQRAGVIE
jgi:glycosyltransferase involved in cell wall biosynthesis